MSTLNENPPLDITPDQDTDQNIGQNTDQNQEDTHKPHRDNQIRTEIRLETVTEHQNGQRLDNFLMAQFRSLPKNKIYQIIRKGEVRVNKGRAKPETKLSKGDVVRIPPVYIATTTEAQAPQEYQDYLLDNILFEDKDILVINKPSGLAVHRGSGSDTGVIECLRAARTDLDFLELVHRLDRSTSGCLLIAKNGVTLKAIQNTKMDKRYLCLVMGRWNKSVFDEKAPLDVENREMGERYVIVSEKGRPAHTRFTPKDDYLGASLLEARLYTGRTHQIRVHAAHSGHPIAGDERYGNETFNAEFKKYGLHRLFLHAHSLMLDFNGKSYAFSAPLPDELNDVLERLIDNKEKKKKSNPYKMNNKTAQNGRQGAPKRNGAAIDRRKTSSGRPRTRSR